MITRVKGTQDHLDLSTYNLFLSLTKKFLRGLSFKEIATPLIEHAELFLRTLGNETDIVTKQMYMLMTNDQEKLCLRPEATASIMRAFLEAQPTTAPWRAFTHGPMFRYERPQKGRYRQFTQLSMEIMQAQSVAYDADFLAQLNMLFKDKLMINNFDLCVNFLGCTQDRTDFKILLQNFLIDKQLCDTCSIRKNSNILRIFDCKNNACQTLYTQAPKIIDTLCSPCSSDWLQLQELLQACSVPYKHVPTLVRGLDYYNKTVFEFTSNHLGSQNAFCSGGRYDGLAQELGSKKEIPALGAAIGIERIVLMIESDNKLSSFKKQEQLFALIPIDQEYRIRIIKLSHLLQNAGLTTELILDGDSIKAKMRKANALGAHYALIIGSEEHASGTIAVKNMITGSEEKIEQNKLISHFIPVKDL